MGSGGAGGVLLEFFLNFNLIQLLFMNERLILEITSNRLQHTRSP